MQKLMGAMYSAQLKRFTSEAMPLGTGNGALCSLVASCAPFGLPNAIDCPFTCLSTGVN